jgi:hypothetical protein
MGSLNAHLRLDFPSDDAADQLEDLGAGLVTHAGSDSGMCGRC